MKTLGLGLLFSLLLCAKAHGAVAYDNAQVVSGNGLSSTTIVGFVAGATNPLITCGSTSVYEATTGVTFNAVSLTASGSAVVQDPPNYQMNAYYLAGQSGTHDVVFSYVAGIGATIGGCISFTGVDQTAPIGGREESINYDGAAITLTVPTDGMAVDFSGSIHMTSICDFAVGNQTARFGVCVEGGSERSAGAGQTGTTSGTYSWTFVEDEWAFQIGFPINPAAATTTRRRPAPMTQ
jgi:hypothetical protein